MTDTMTSMELIHIDTLDAWALEPDDMIDIDGEIVTVVDVKATETGYLIDIVNDFGEDDSVHVGDDDRFHLYMFD